MGILLRINCEKCVGLGGVYLGKVTALFLYWRSFWSVKQGIADRVGAFLQLAHVKGVFGVLLQ